MNKDEFIYYHWNYYLSLEKDVLELENYISFNGNNLSTFSIKNMEIIIKICCEFETMCKLILNIDGSEFTKIDRYRDICSINEYLDITKEQLEFINYINLDSLHPLDKFSNITPKWWTAYNNLKHNRINKFSEANLKNLLNALGALYIIEVYYYKNNYFKNFDDCNIPNKESKLFKLKLLKQNFISNISAKTIGTF